MTLKSESEYEFTKVDRREASEIIDKAERIFYVKMKETFWLFELRNLVYYMLMESLVEGKRNYPLNHIRLVAQGLIYFKCPDCKRCYASRQRLHDHNDRCGLDEVLYGYLKFEKRSFACIICGVKIYSRNPARDKMFKEHTREHTTEELNTFGLGSRK